MKFLQDRLGKLHWQLTLSYTLVTVATLLVLELCVIAGIGYLIVNSNILPGALIAAVDFFIVPQVSTFLDQPQPDVESMADWLKIAYSEGIKFQSSQNPNITFHLGDLDQGSILVVLDNNFNRLAGIPEPGPGNPLEIDKISNGILSAALNGKTDADSISQISDNLLVVAVPVTDVANRVLGIVLMGISYPPRGTIFQIIPFIGTSLIVFAVAAGLVGTIFGYITARNPTRRLKKVSSSAQSWSQGDFSNFIQDNSMDEIGELARQLNRMAEQLQNLIETKGDLAALEERNRLASDLHDSVKQQIFATSMQVGAARAMLDQDLEDAREHLEEAEKLSSSAQIELNALILNLHPVSLEGKGLIKGLHTYIDDWSRQNGVQVEGIAQEGVNLKPEVKQAFFRIIQEALANIARHSGATMVKIQLSPIEGGARLSISDNGKGFNIESAFGRGFGLQGMRERMESLGGELEIESEPGTGSQITAIYKD